MMIIECIGSPFTYRWPTGEVRLVPGQPVELPDDRAARLLEKAPGRVRVVALATRAGDTISWTRADGSHPAGVVDDLHTDPAGVVWAFITLPGGLWTAVNLKFARVA